jgi:DNA-binding transcriptional LysR family regulator
MVAMPGETWRGPLPPADDDLQRLAGRLRSHVQAIGAREHNVWALAELEAAAAYIERELAAAGHAVRHEAFRSYVAPVRLVDRSIELCGKFGDLAFRPFRPRIDVRIQLVFPRDRPRSRASQQLAGWLTRQYRA